ncbi:MAG: S9 family peptidase, partial [Pseudomonadota bacterium]
SFLLLAMCLLGCASSSRRTENKAPAPSAAAQTAKAPKAPVPLAEYFNIRRVGEASFSHDEKLIAYASDKGGRMDVWVQPIKGGEANQITHVGGFIHSIAFSPTRDQLLFEADEGGNELPHIFLTDSKGAAPQDLMTDDPKGSRTVFIRWADNGRSFLYLSNRRDPKYLDVWKYTMKTKKSDLLWKSSGKLSVALTSRDHKRFIIKETLSDADANIYLFDVRKNKLTLLTPHKGDIQYSPTAFSKDGEKLYFTSDEGREFTALFVMNLNTKRVKLLHSENWDVQGGSFTKGWRYFKTVINVDGTPKVILEDIRTKKIVEMPKIGKDGVLFPSESSNTDRYVAGYLITDISPGTLYVVDLKRGTAKELVNVLPPALQKYQMVRGKVVRIPSFDKWKVPAFIHIPAGQGPFPAVIDVHGGPTSQSWREFRGIRQYLVSKGYVVLVPNVRGSTGYGKSYTQLDNLDLGGGPLQDIVYCKKWLVEHAMVDKDRVVVMGGSYGGYMALAAATFTPTEFAANVDFFGVSDLKSLVQSFPPYWTAFATYIYKKFGDPNNPAHAKYQYERSPGNFVEKIQRPLLVVQGENDARVRKDQSDRIVEKLRKRKVPVHYLIIPGEGHGFSKNENRLKAYETTDRFLDRYIFKDVSVQVLNKK